MVDVNQGYEAFCDFLEKHSGICLGASKQYLVSSRLRKILQEASIGTLTELVAAMSRAGGQSLRSDVIDAMTTNETLWFRDIHPFRILEEQLLPEFYQQKVNRPLRIWSAACSTGQEPYSISMMIEEFKQKNRVFSAGEKIIATDISNTALDAAKSAEYAMLAIGRGLDPERLKRHFEETPGGRWKVKTPIAQRVEFRPMNLQDSYALLGKFDIVFCRNVLIYFTAEFKRDILTRIHATLNPGGYLMVGASEAVNGLGDLYEMVHCRPGIIYRKR
ncbi:CheR family methyltransferase [Saccharospirillum mangrovi]|uniref:CheR family methyltransferase n=1 Tax=Saccharospirillum mangrovi TaxID=2161747 RepID=UPI000D38D884|nr:protein-glutamate O-methyltransferase CheR [Saccharospirillum mangrovi]